MWASYTGFVASGRDASGTSTKSNLSRLREGLQRQKSVAEVAKAPGKIWNEPLLRVTKSVLLQHDLEAGKDVVMISRRMWFALSSWYGADTTLGRGVIPSSGCRRDERESPGTPTELELHPPFVCVR